MKNGLKIVLPVLAVVVLATTAFVIYGRNNAGKKQSGVTPTQQEQEPEESFQFLRQIEIAKGHQVRMLFANDHFYISYKKTNRSVTLKIYDVNLKPQGEEIILKNVQTPDYKIAFSGEHFFLSDASRLRKYDLNWDEVKSVSYLEQLPVEIAKQWEHGVDDMILSCANGSIYLGVAVGNAPPESMKGKEKEKKPDLADNLYLLEYDLNLELKNKVMLKDVGNVPSSSIISEDGSLIVVTGDRHWDDSSLIMLRYDKNRNLLERKVISAEANANEEFPMTVLFDRGVYYVGYHRITGDISQPVSGEPVRSTDIVVKAYDTKWSLLGRLPKENDTLENNPQGITGWFDLVLVKDKMYLVSDNEQEEVILKEYLMKITR